MDDRVYEEMSRNEQGFWWHRGNREISARLLSRFLPHRQGLAILDAGCGTGGNFSMLSRLGSVTGIDQSEKALEYASRKGYDRLLKAGVEKIPFPDESFDLVACFEVLYHSEVGEDSQALKEFFRVLKPGGILILREAAYDFLRGRIDRMVWTKKRYTLKELKKKTRLAGFQILKSSYVIFFLFPGALLSRLAERMIGHKDDNSELFHSNPFVDKIFYQVLRAESRLLDYLNFPFGLSAILIAKKKD